METFTLREALLEKILFDDIKEKRTEFDLLHIAAQSPNGRSIPSVKNTETE